MGGIDMTENERGDFGQLVTAALAYYRQDATPFVLDVWWQGCKPFSMEQLRKALTGHATDPERGVYAPKVADVVRVLGGTQTDKSLMAWGRAFDAMSSVGAYTDVVFDDPAIHAAIADCGGWTKMCRSDMDELSYLQHRFCQAHRAYSGREGYDYPRILNGDRSPDDMYAKRGLKPPKPTVIGDIERARLVYKGGATRAASFQSLATLLPAMEVVNA